MVKNKIIYLVIFIVILISTLVVLKLFPKSPYNLTKPEYKSLEIESKKYSVIIQKYNPPLMFKKLLQNEEEMDRTTPEGIYLGMRSATNKDWYLSLFDKSVQEEFLKSDRESGGKVFKDMEKRTKSLQELNFKFICICS